MNAPNHQERAHAVLSASGSAMWLACPPAARLNELFPNEDSEYSAEGTKIHELGEILLGNYVARLTTKPEDWCNLTLHEPIWDGYTQVMIDTAMAYVTEVAKILDPLVASGEPVVVFVEQRVDYSPWVPEGFGTSDCIILTKTRMWCIDLKGGQGIQVFAENNTQAMLYGLGAWNEHGWVYDEIEEIIPVIIQPRLNHVDSWSIRRDDLLAWAESIKPVAERAFVLDAEAATEADFCPGAHCSKNFCRARFTCAARAKYLLGLASKRGLLLADRDLALIAEQLPLIEKWAKELQTYMLDQAVNSGVQYEGFKLVEGRSNRYITDPEAALKRFTDARIPAKDVLKAPELRGITELEKTVGKKLFGDLLLGLIDKAPGKPVLVPVSDKRAVWVPKASADDDFADPADDFED